MFSSILKSHLIEVDVSHTSIAQLIEVRLFRVFEISLDLVSTSATLTVDKASSLVPNHDGRHSSDGENVKSVKAPEKSEVKET